MTAQAAQQNFETEAMPYFRNVRGMAMRLAKNKNDAEDLVQETFMQAWKSFEKYKRGTNCRAWLFKILMNKYLHFRRGHGANKKMFLDVDEFVFQNAKSSAQVSVHLTNKEVIRSINQIPELYRNVVVLVDVYEFSYKESAKALGIPVGTVMSRLSRGRKLLRSAFAKGTGKKAHGFKNTVDYLVKRYA